MNKIDRIAEILNANNHFQERIDPQKLPKRAPESLAIITCMDPRINLESVGIPSFSSDGEGYSNVRIIRTIGGMAESRSLIIGIYLAGIHEFVLLMHTDCGCCLASAKIDTIIENMEKRLGSDQFQIFKEKIGNPFRSNLKLWLKAFDDPKEAIHREIAGIRAQSFMPKNIILHGLLYHTESGIVELVVNGYDVERAV